MSEDEKLSDEEFMAGLDDDPAEVTEETDEAPVPTDEPEQEEPVGSEEEEPAGTEEGAGEEEEGAEGADGEGDSSADAATTPYHTTPEGGEEPGGEAAEGSETAEGGEEESENKNEEEAAADPHKEFYEQITAPFKANGREVKVESAEEAKKLMQMGANYTKKMQALSPNLKKMRSLEKAGLLDDDRLNHMIDLANGDQRAIQKLLKDKNVDPMDIDTSEDASSYAPKNHSLSDAEHNFQTTVEDIMSADNGRETVQEIHSNWDETSKQVLFQDPSLMETIHEQRSNGIYAKIADEVERRRMTGSLSRNEPFLHAYEKVGKELDAQGAFAPQDNSAGQPKTDPAPQQERQVVASAPATRKKQTANGQRAKAAATGRQAPKTPQKKPEFDPLSMSDEEFQAAVGTNV